MGLFQTHRLERTLNFLADNSAAASQLRSGVGLVLSIFGLFPFTDHQRLVVLSKDLENKTNFNG